MYNIKEEEKVTDIENNIFIIRNVTDIFQSGKPKIKNLYKISPHYR